MKAIRALVIIGLATTLIGVASPVQQAMAQRPELDARAIMEKNFFVSKVSTLMIDSTMVISAFFALFFLRALMMLFKPRFVFGDRRDALFNLSLIHI